MKKTGLIRDKLQNTGQRDTKLKYWKIPHNTGRMVTLF